MCHVNSGEEVEPNPGPPNQPRYQIESAYGLKIPVGGAAKIALTDVAATAGTGLATGLTLNITHRTISGTPAAAGAGVFLFRYYTEYQPPQTAIPAYPPALPFNTTALIAHGTCPCQSPL